MPVGGMDMGKGPLDPLEAETATDDLILVNVIGVIVIDEIVANSAAEDEQRSKKQRGTDRNCAAVELHGRLRLVRRR